MGGRSLEREVSFNSGRTVCDHIDASRYDVVPIFQAADGLLFLLPLKFLHRGKTADFEKRLSSEAKQVSWDNLKKLVDFIYIAVHGRYAEDGTLQGILEVLGIPYLGSKVSASALGMDKVIQKDLLRMQNISVPKDLVLTSVQIKTLSLSQVERLLAKEKLSFPFIVKPVREGSSFGISVVHSLKELPLALKKACWQDVTQEQPVLIEEKIEGMEFTCIALEKSNHLSLSVLEIGRWHCLPATEVIPEEGTGFHDYEQKYMPGRSTKITPARCSSEQMKSIHEACVRVSDTLEFSTFFRIDGFLTKDKKIIIIDPNTLSGMGPASFLFHQAAHVGLNHTQLINYLIDAELERYGLLKEVISFQELKNKKNMSKESQEKKRIIVLLGGDSNEREISLESGRNVCYKLSPSKYEVIPVFVDDQMNLYKLSAHLLIQNSTRDIKKLLTQEIQIKWDDLPSLCDFVFIALHGGKGESGSVQGTLEMLGLPYNGPGVLTSSLCMDKQKTNEFLKQKGFDVPASVLLKRGDVEAWEEKISGLKFPLILKPSDDGCSMLVSKVSNKKEFKVAFEEYFTSEKNILMVEEFVYGMELTCGVVGNDEITVFPPSRTVITGDILSIEEKFLPGAGENQTPAPLPAQAIALVQETIKKAYLALGCVGYSRIDCFYQDEKTSPTKKQRVVILEVNSLPGLTPATCLFHQAAEIGLKPMELIDKIVELGFEK
ncbi:ATP-grasp domain-containing protein [Candidatus Babeliales bacterium]|nr:ATP-grasp domain-containing protein [Candidatus Babeliales bacterium]